MNTASEKEHKLLKEALKINKLEDNFNELFTISKLNPYKYNNKKAKSNNKISYSILNHKILSELNKSEKKNKQKKFY